MTDRRHAPPGGAPGRSPDSSGPSQPSEAATAPVAGATDDSTVVKLPTEVAGLSSGITRGGLWSLGGQIAVLVASLLATPFVVRLLAPELYGLLSLIQALIAYIGFAGVGTSLASTKFGAEALARHDDDGEVAVVWTSLAIVATPAILAGLGFWLTARSFMDALSVPPALQGQGVLALRIAIIGFVARAVYGCLNTPQAVRLRWDLITKIEAGTSILQISLVPVILALGGGLVAAVTASTAVEGLRVLLHVVYSSRLQSRLLHPQVRRQLIGPIVRFGGAMALSSMLMIPLRTVERFFVARYGSVASVAYYSLAVTLATTLAVLPMAICQPLLPAFARLRSTGDSEGLRSIYIRAVRAILVVTVAVTVLLFVLARPAFTLWAGTEYARHSTGPFYVLTVGLAVNALAYPAVNVLLAANRPNVIARYYAVQLLPYVALVAALTYSYGAAGAALGYSVRMAGDWLYFSWMARRESAVAISPLPENRGAYAWAVGALLLPNVLGALLTSSSALRILVCVGSIAWYARIVTTKVVDDEQLERMTELLRRIRTRRPLRAR